MLGIFIASLLAAVMSSCDSFMIASSGLFTENIYKSLKPNRPAKHYVWVGRGVALVVVVAGGLVWTAAGRIVRPIRALTDMAALTDRLAAGAAETAPRVWNPALRPPAAR